VAKTRVYELGKMLDMDNEELLEHLKRLNYPVKSHMSTLDGEQIEEIKEKLSSLISGKVVEKRVSSGVIRRRVEPVKIEKLPKEKVTPLREEAEEEVSEKPLKEEIVQKIEIKKAKKEPRKIVEKPAEIIKLPEHLVGIPEVREQLPKVGKPPETLEIKKVAKVGEVGGKTFKKKRPKRHVEEVILRHPLSRKKQILERAQLYEGDERGIRPYRLKKPIRVAVRRVQKPEITVPKAIKRRIKLVDTITVSELAKKMGIKGSEVIKKLMAWGMMATLNQAIDFDTAALVASDFDYDVEKVGFAEDQILQVEEDIPDKLRPRPPVVTIMGHVDHGKTSLLDAIRETKVMEQEAGGITQHIGAYHVSLNGRSVIFLDTPGHEAFTAMRARGAQVTDVVVLVVAADDGVMDQTTEAINHAKAANVPIIVAINKIDKPDANPEKVKRQLADYGLVPEEWGGNTLFANISAKQRKGISELLEMIVLQAEVLEFKANPDKPARGRIVEARLDRGKGPVATVLVQEGTINVGDPFVCGVTYGRVRALFDDTGNKVRTAGPSLPVEVQGISGVPMASDEFIVVEDEKKAKQVSLYRQQKQREAEILKTGKISLEKLHEYIKKGKVKELNIVLRADVQGSIEALSDALKRLSTSEVTLNTLHSSTGAVTETDIMLAAASNAIVIGFNVRPNPKAYELANQEKVDVRCYDVIYKVTSDIKDAMAGLLTPTYEERVLGHVEVRQLFFVSKVGTVAGSYVTDGKIERGCKLRLIRDKAVVYDGRIASLKRFKEDVKEVLEGYECGILLENYNDVKVGDILEPYFIEEIKPVLE